MPDVWNSAFGTGRPHGVERSWHPEPDRPALRRGRSEQRKELHSSDALVFARSYIRLLTKVNNVDQTSCDLYTWETTRDDISQPLMESLPPCIVRDLPASKSSCTEMGSKSGKGPRKNR